MAHFAYQGGTCQAEEYQDNLQGCAEPGGKHRAEPEQAPGGEEDEQNEADGEQGAFELSMLPFVEGVLTCGNHLAEEDDGMREASGVAQQHV